MNNGQSQNKKYQGLPNSSSNQLFNYLNLGPSIEKYQN
jgi:hypothetical protein